MEDNRNHIDDLLREKMQDMHFELNEQHWADAERRLDEDDKKKRPIWLLLFVVVALVGAGITALTKSGEHKSNPGFSKKSPETEQISNQQSNPTGISNAENIANIDVEEYSNKTTAPISPVGVDKNAATNNNVTKRSNTAAFTSSKSKRVNKSSNNIVANNASSSNRNLSSATNSQQNGVTNAASNNLAKSRSNINNKSVNQGVHSNNSQPKKPAATNLSAKKGKSIANSDSRLKDPVTASNNKTDNLAMAKPSKQSDKSSKTNPVANNKPATTTGTKPVMLGNARVYRTPEEYQKMNPRYVAGLENYAYTKTVISLSEEKSDSLRQVIEEQNAVTADKEVKAEAKQKAPRKENIYIQEPSNFYMLLGAAGARGYMGNLDATPVWGLSPELGLGYQFTFSDRMSIYLSAFMSYVSHLNIKESGTNVTYSFDRDSTLFSVTRKSLLQLHLPLELAYKVRPKHQLYGGLGINLNLNSFSLFEDAKANSNKREFGYMDGIRMLDVTANFGYEYLLSPRMRLGVFYQQGFFDITKNDYFNNQHKDINARGGIRLRYKFNK